MDAAKKTDNDPTMEDNEAALQNETEEKQSVCQFFLEGRCRFDDKCRNSHEGSPEASPNSTTSKSRSGKGKKTSDPKGKKPPMKTATDVISRIQWDTNLSKDHFSVGYLDRFLGVIEKPFSAFCWEDLACTGIDVLAIPKHRIQYFKYQKLVVWDKTNRTDNVFGSTGSGLTILDIFEQYESLVQADPTHEDTTTEVTPERRYEDTTTEVTPERTYEDTTTEVTSDMLDNETEDGMNSHYEDHFNERNPKKIRPTHFIAVRISSEEVRNSVKEVQHGLSKHNPDMAEFFTPVPELHLTLCLLHLETTDQIELAYTVIEEIKTEIQRILPPSLILSFEGLKDFHSRVLYLSPTSVPGLPSFINTLNQSFRAKGLTVIDPPTSNSFHVTVAKVPRNVASKNPKLLFLPELYNHFQIGHFGAQHIDSLSFCYAGSSRRTDGFYTTLLEIPLY